MFVGTGKTGRKSETAHTERKRKDTAARERERKERAHRYFSFVYPSAFRFCRARSFAWMSLGIGIAILKDRGAIRDGRGKEEG